MKIHITKQGETLDEITKKYNQSKQDVMGINPHIDFNAGLVSGLKLKIPETSEIRQTSNMENFYPRLNQNGRPKEEAIPIGLKPLPSVEAPPTDGSTNSHHPIYGHLKEGQTSLNAVPPHPPWNPYFPGSPAPDMRLLFPPFYPPYSAYPYPYPYPYPAYGFPLPIPGFGYGSGFGHGWHGGHHGHGGHHR